MMDEQMMVFVRSESLPRTWPSLCRIAFGDDLASGRLGECLTVIFSVFKTVRAMLRKRVLRNRGLEIEHPLSRHHFDLRHDRLVPRQLVS